MPILEEIAQGKTILEIISPKGRMEIRGNDEEIIKLNLKIGNLVIDYTTKKIHVPNRELFAKAEELRDKHSKKDTYKIVKHY